MVRKKTASLFNFQNKIQNSIYKIKLISYRLQFHSIENIHHHQLETFSPHYSCKQRWDDVCGDIAQIGGWIRIISNGNVIQAKCGFHFVLSNRWNEPNEKFSIYTAGLISLFVRLNTKRIRIQFTTTRRIPRY